MSSWESKRRIWDISQMLRPGLPVWPGDTGFAFERTSIHGRSANCVRILSRTASWSAGDDWSPHVPARQDATWNVRDQLNA